MTQFQAPKIDPRSAEQLLEEMDEIARRLRVAPVRGVFGAALQRVFARYCEIIIERLNQAPEKNHLAFLNLLAVSQAPPSPARVPLTFIPVKQLPNPAVPGGMHGVPRHTRVAAAGSGEPVVFETERDLVLTAARLCRIMAYDPETDLESDLSECATPEGGSKADPFAGDSPAEHAVYIGDSIIFGTAELSELRLRLDIAGHCRPLPPDSLEWFIPIPDGKPIKLSPVEDTTGRWTHGGEVVFKDLPPWPRTEAFARNSCWLVCRWKKRLRLESSAEGTVVPPAGSTEVRGVQLEARGKIGKSSINQACFNQIPLDISKAFFPLGERPRFGDAFYLSSEAFARQGASIALDIKLHNPTNARPLSGIRPVNGDGKPHLLWEMWNGEGWLPVAAQDKTQGLTRDGNVILTPAASAAKHLVNGRDGYWLRAQLVAGHYGEDERIEFSADDPTGQAYRRIPSTLAPPVIQTITVTGSTILSAKRPEWILTRNGLALEPLDPARQNSFLPFAVPNSPLPSLFFGFSSPQALRLDAPILDLYLEFGDSPESLFSRNEIARTAPEVSWQVWNGLDWQNLRVEDGTSGLQVSGTVRLFLGTAARPWRQCALGGDLYWVRATRAACGPRRARPMRRVAVNTVPAIHTATLRNELLGTSNGNPAQVFRSIRRPILGEVRLEVREPEPPASVKLEGGKDPSGEDDVTVERGERDMITAVWVRWHEVDDFLSSTPDDRHFRLDRLSGVVRFGDGVRGRIPPSGANNIRLARYRSGGGASGNQPAGSLTQLRTTVPFVAAATNLASATGGLDAESLDSAGRRGTRWLRHRGRAVTAEDYEDLALEASPGVARAKCYPARDLLRESQAESPGVVSIIVVPHQDVPDPKPSSRLLEDVRQFLEQNCLPELEVITLAPVYVRVCVEIRVKSAPSVALYDCQEICSRRLRTFLHPVTGGWDKCGWEFGRLPKQSDLLRLVDDAEGLGTAMSVSVRLEEERPGVLKSGVFLVCSGEHRLETVP